MVAIVGTAAWAEGDGDAGGAGDVAGDAEGVGQGVAADGDGDSERAVVAADADGEADGVSADRESEAGPQGAMVAVRDAGVDTTAITRTEIAEAASTAAETNLTGSLGRTDEPEPGKRAGRPPPWPVAEHDAPYEPVFRHRPEYARILGDVPVVPHHEVVSGRQDVRLHHV